MWTVGSVFVFVMPPRRRGGGGVTCHTGLAPSSVKADMDFDTSPRTALVAWLQTDDALAAARAELHRRGLELYDAVDLLNDVAVRVLAATIDDDIANPAGYARRALALRTIDLLRGERLRPHEPLPDWFDEVADDDLDVDPADLTAAELLADGLRRSLASFLERTKSWTVAAALSTLTLRTHPDVAVPDDVPEPGGSSSAGQADVWAALWLAGERDVFGDGAAQRQARSRKLRAVEGLLRLAAEAVLGGGEGDDA
jgi:DNA-directed RNA polymerase specialized sigma24 family protein